VNVKTAVCYMIMTAIMQLLLKFLSALNSDIKELIVWTIGPDSISDACCWGGKANMHYFN
jgi:hypothetical protein